MSTLKVNKLRDTAGSSDAIVLDPNGGAVLAGVTTVSTVKVGSGVTISSDGDVFTTGITTSSTVIVGSGVTISESGIEASGIGITVANINGGHIGGRRNIVINGGMRIHQRVTSSHTLNSGNANAYIVDRFLVKGGEGTIVASQDSDVPTGQGFVKSIKLDCTGADTSLGANFESYIQYLPESQDLTHLAYGTSGAKTVTFSFWVKSNLTSGFGFYYYMPDTSRAYQTSFTVSSANTWEKKVITVVGDTSGSGFANDNGIGAEIRLYLAGGAGKVGSSNQNAWGTDVSNRIPSGTNILSSTDNNFYFTGFQMEIGDQATPFEHRNFGEELLLCQRYFQEVRAASITAASTTAARFNCPLLCEMRSEPSVGKGGSGNINIGDMVSHGSNTSENPGSDGYSGDKKMMSCQVGGFSSLVAYRQYCHEPSSGNLGLITCDAEF